MDVAESEEFNRLIQTENRANISYPSYITGAQFIKIGKNFIGHTGLRINCISSYAGITTKPELIIGDDVIFNYRCHIGCINRIRIGDRCLFGSNVMIIDHSHGSFSPEDIVIPPFKRKLFSKGPIVIENDVWVGENVCIMPGIHIGHHSVIGAGSVVTKDIPAYSLAVGSPAKIIKTIERN
jgi:acetyltransferase-like isoleucine patch superfamily enzyme